MNIPEEVRISKHQPAVFLFDTEYRELYKAMKQYWRLDRDNCQVFAASLFYNLGRVHGIREERARRKKVGRGGNCRE